MSELPSSPRASWLDLNLSKYFRLENVIAICIVLLAILSRFYGLGDRAMSHDEVNHVVPSYDLSQGQGYSYDPMTHGPLQFHLIAASFILFGDNDFTARIPAAIFSVVTIAFVLFAFRRYLGRMGTLAAGVMFLISPFMLFYGRYARNEAFIVLWSVITIYAVLRYLERGSLGDLTLFTLVNAFHFIDKTTAYIFAAEELLFLGVYLLIRLNRNERFRAAITWRNMIILAAGLLFVSLGILMLRIVPADANFYAKIPGLLFGGCGLTAIVFSVVAILQETGSEALRGERSFDLLVMLGTLVLPLLGALVMKLFGLDTNNASSISGQLTDFAIVLALFIPAIWLGIWWKGSIWATQTIAFYAIFFLFYTTFTTNITNIFPFTSIASLNNGTGLASGFIRGLGYWMEQQPVDRGSQPWYLYLLIEMPVYEFLPFIGTILAVFVGLRHNLWSAPTEKPFREPDEIESTTTVPTLALLVFWSFAQLIAFTIAGEKMGWLTIHITTPMILTCAWVIGYSYEKIKSGILPDPARWVQWCADRMGRSRQISKAVLDAAVVLQQMIPGLVLTVLGLLAVLTMRTSIQAAYYNYDYPFEYLVYAHGTPAPKQIFNEIEQVSFRATGDRNLVVAYDNNVRYPYWWYLRHYPNRIDFNDTPTSSIRNAAYILVGEENRSKVQPFLKNNYVEFRLPRLWWPNQDYFGLKWDDVQTEYQQNKTQAGISDPPPMNWIDYLSICWERVSPMFSNINMRDAVFQVWLNRDFTKWSQVQGRSGYTLADWSITDWMYVYIRKDYLGGYDGKAQPAGFSNQPDPYQEATIALLPDLTLGSVGNQPGKFSAPHGLAAAKDGSLFIADSFNHRIQHLSTDGTVLVSFGTRSPADGTSAPEGTFNEPWGVAVGPDGSVYVADTWNDRIQKFDSSGNFLTMWGSGGQAKDGPDKFYGPRAVAVSQDGKVFVADTGNKRIAVFNADGNYITQFGEEGSGAGQLDEPVGLALDNRGYVYVADTWNSRIQVFAPGADGSYNVVTAWDVDGWYGQDPTNKPFLTVDGSYNVFITDPTTCRIIEFSQTGTVLAVWGTCGEGTGQLGLPTGIVWSNFSGLWVSDAKNNTLIHYSPPGNAAGGQGSNPPNNGPSQSPSAQINQPTATVITSTPSPTSAVASANHDPITISGAVFRFVSATLAADLKGLPNKTMSNVKGEMLMSANGWMPKDYKQGEQLLIIETNRQEGDMKTLTDLDLRLATGGTESPASLILTTNDTAYWIFQVNTDTAEFILSLPDGRRLDIAPLMKS